LVKFDISHSESCFFNHEHTSFPFSNATHRRGFLHEETDIFRVAKLKKRIETSGILRNPPIVANMDSGYVVLDGATRTTSLKEIGASHILAQVVHYAKMALMSKHGIIYCPI
jgi:hypothetical protein